MYQIIDSRGSGKTSRLLLLAKENNGIIVCSNPNAMEEKAKAYGINDGIEFQSYARFINPFYPKSDKPVYIDELGNFIQSLGRGNIQGYTLSIED